MTVTKVIKPCSSQGCCMSDQEDQLSDVISLYHQTQPRLSCQIIAMITIH